MSSPAHGIHHPADMKGVTALRRACLQAILLLVVAIAAAFAFARFGPAPKEIAREISLDEVATKLAGQKILWLDARSAAAFAEKHLPGAIWLADEQWEEGLPKFVEAWTPGQPIVVYCSSTQCGSSRAVANRLVREFNASPVYYLHGGWDALEARKP